jgi:DNA-binding HxlR family transcriptional regulator
LRLLWELRGGDGLTFRALEEAAELAPATLNVRLRDLRALGLVEVEQGYKLSMIGLELVEALAPLNAWAERWARARKRP